MSGMWTDTDSSKAFGQTRAKTLKHKIKTKQVLKESTRPKSLIDTSRVLNILYISVTSCLERPYLDSSTRYRCFYAVEAARGLGHRAFIATQAALATVDPLLFDLVVIHRPAFTAELLRFIKAAQASGVQLVADYDDLTFDPAYATQSSTFLRSWNYTSVLSAFERNTDALRLFDKITVSTKPLKDHVLALHPAAKVSVLPNSIPPTLWSLIAGRGYQKMSDRPFIGYFSGAPTHDRDFQVASEGLANFCRMRRIPLRLVGPVQADANLFHGIEVERLALQPFSDMFDKLSGCRIVIAPLVASFFNNAKSHIKFIEAALCCTACVASSVPDMAQHRGTTQPMSLVGEDGDWQEALSERWDSFDLNIATQARSALFREFSSDRIYRPFFTGAV